MMPPKRRRSKKRQRTARNTHEKQKVTLPQLFKLPSGTWVPLHMVVPENPFHKGVKFLRTSKKK